MAAKKKTTQRKQAGRAAAKTTRVSSGRKSDSVAGATTGRSKAGSEAVRAVRSTDPLEPAPKRTRSARAKSTRVANPKRSTTSQASKRTGARKVDGRGARA